MIAHLPLSHESHDHKRRWLTVLSLAAAGLGILCVVAWLFRAPLVTFVVREYLASQGVRSRIVVDSINLGGLTAHGELGSKDAPDVSFERMVVTFNSKRGLPEVVEVDILHPTIRLAIDRNGVSLGSLQPWIDARKIKSANIFEFPSFVSSDLVIDIAYARIFAATSAGFMEIDANVRLKGGKPKTVAATIRSAHLHSGMVSATIEGGKLKGVSSRSGIGLRAFVSGSLEANLPSGPVHMDRARLSIDVPKLRWENLAGEITVPESALLSLDSGGPYRQGATPVSLSARVQLLNLKTVIEHGHVQSSGDVVVALHGSLSPADAGLLTGSVPLLASDHHTASALVAAARDLTLGAHLSWRTLNEETVFVLDGPAQLSGAGPITLRLSPLPKSDSVRIGPSDIAASIGLSLSGRGVPNFAFVMPEFSWRRADDQLDGVLSLEARFDAGGFQNVMLSGQANAQLYNGAFELRLQHCAAARVATLKLRQKQVVSDANITFCAINDEPFFSASRAGWILRGVVKDGSANLNAAGLKLSASTARGLIDGTSAGLWDATIDVATTVSDRAKTRRIAPQLVTGKIKLVNSTVQGHFEIAAGANRTRIGTAIFTHQSRTGHGHAAIDLPNIAFDTKGLKPSDISPLLSAMAQTNGSARFTGRIDWSPKHIESGGRLDIDDLQFTSPLGAAQRLRTHIIFTSLLPPATAPNQQIDIARVDWVSPLTQIESHFSFVSSQLHIQAARTEFASGSISLAPLSIDLPPSTSVTSAAHLSHVGLGTLIDVSNLGSKIHLDGRISGSIPFSFGPQGMRFANGHIEADGPGRLSIDPSLWGRSQPNAVEKVAYQALENLAFQSLSATIDSEPAGRLRIVFHIKGYNDSPGPGEAQIGLLDLIQGTAFQKNIPLPRGTPIDLTLDTSLNFDELLRGYETAWSQATARAQ